MTAAIQTSTIESVFEVLVRDIVQGAYPARSRLPAERELAKALGASRPTLREALRRLVEWNLVEAKRGSGITVLESREWTIEVLPSFLRYGASAMTPAHLLETVEGLLRLRRALSRELSLIVAPKLRAGGLNPARSALRKTWALREDGAAFAREDFKVFRMVVEAADFMPAVWMLNRGAGVYREVTGLLSGLIKPPPGYLEAYETFFDTLESQDGEAASATIDRYLKMHDERLLAVLKGEA